MYAMLSQSAWLQRLAANIGRVGGSLKLPQPIALSSIGRSLRADASPPEAIRGRKEDGEDAIVSISACRAGWTSGKQGLAVTGSFNGRRQLQQMKG
jgi:hypothetical protein